MHRRRLYRKKIKCTACNKIIYSDYKVDHLTRKHNNNSSVKFISVEEDPLQKKLCFATAITTSSKASIATDNSTYSTSASLAITDSVACEVDKCEESVPANENVFEPIAATKGQERLNETVIQLKDQNDDLHEVKNGDAGDKEKDFATNSEIFILSANSEMVENVLNEPEDKDYETVEGHAVDRVKQSFATTSHEILTFSANADIIESVTIESDDDNLSLEPDSENAKEVAPSHDAPAEGPYQSILKSYDRKLYQNKSRDFNP